ncbi:restriction endonuclease subunit S [Psychrobacter okhotskensis]|uniref:restriction endonuclease subunit S n=1 Tax=Psychrobacter okhotskensis TaxID=212403 RepID=UPI0019192CA4|nr:restriction endonuclease subunit S [Psychrobacter okhotskensis]
MVPKGWEEKPLIKLLDKIIDYRGQSVPKADNGIPLITARNVRFGYLDFSNQEYVDEGEFENWMSRGIPDVGDILFTTEAPLGMACRFPEKGRYAVAQRTVTLRTSNRLHSDFLLYFLLSEHGQRLIDIRSSGSTAKGIKSAELKKVKLLHPTCINEQQKIAKILSTWDKAISTTERLIENSTQQKKALMQQLLTGKKRLLDDNGERFSGEWENQTIENLTSRVGDGIHSTPKYTNKSSIRFVNGNNLNNGSIVFSDSTKFVDEEDAKNHHRNLSDRTILMSINGTIGNLAIYKDEDIVLGKSACYINVKEEVDVLFIFYKLASSEVQSHFISRLTGSTIKNLSLTTIKSMQLALPSLKEQQKIAAVLTNADKEIEALEQQLAHLQQEKKALMQVLLTGKKRVVVDGEVA